MTDPLTRLTDALAERYRIERELGAGGMATVYLAHDFKHDRRVAIKVLRPELSAVIGAERFLVEIKTTANLQHLHILPLHDSGEVNGTVFYVMPYVEGESLRDMLDRDKQLPISDAVRIASEVASALDYAHRHGVIHRDIKPENILLHDGRALVADFGIALAASTSGSRMTETGMSLGTPHYMSPEQALGEREITARSDIYSLGAMTYEMLSGEPPFTGPTAQAIVAKVMTADPVPLTRLRKTVPEHVNAAVLTALQKLPADRFTSCAAYAEALGGRTPISPIPETAATPFGKRTLSARSLAAWGGWGIALIAVAFGFSSWSRQTKPVASRFAVAFPQSQALDLTTAGSHIAVSRDGSMLVYTGSDSTGGRLWVKMRDALAATPIAGTEGAYDPFISPDGRFVGFTTDRDGRSMKVVPLAGGPARVVGGAPLGTGGADWGDDGYIYFDADERGLQRIKPDGTGRETVMPLDSSQNEFGIAWPQVLPGSKIVILRLRHANDTPADFTIIAARPGTNERRVVASGISARHAAGRLILVTSDGTLETARFDERRLALAGPPVVAANGVRISSTFSGVDLSITDDGTLFYISGASGATSQLEWIGRDGAERVVDPTWHETGDIRGLALSPDGSRVALELVRPSTGANIWIKSLPAGPLTRLTLEAGADTRPSWSGDGHKVLFLSSRVTPDAVFTQDANGGGNAVLLARSSRAITEASQSRDSQWLIARSTLAASGLGDILAMRVGTDTALRPIIEGPASETNPAISPDGKWIAYTSTATGRREIYVRPFPDVNRAVWQVSTDGGGEPRWAHSGRELFFRSISGQAMMVVDIETSPVFRAGAQRVLFRIDAARPIAMGFDFPRYDVSPDDKLFLMVGRADAEAAPQLVRVENFFQTAAVSTR